MINYSLLYLEQFTNSYPQLPTENKELQTSLTNLPDSERNLKLISLLNANLYELQTGMQHHSVGEEYNPSPSSLADASTLKQVFANLPKVQTDQFHQQVYNSTDPDVQTQKQIMIDQETMLQSKRESKAQNDKFQHLYVKYPFEVNGSESDSESIQRFQGYLGCFGMGIAQFGFDQASKQIGRRAALAKQHYNDLLVARPFRTLILGCVVTFQAFKSQYDIAKQNTGKINNINTQYSNLKEDLGKMVKMESIDGQNKNKFIGLTNIIKTDQVMKNYEKNKTYQDKLINSDTKL